MLGPRLNAAGRIDDALLSYQLLLADDFPAARVLADTLNQANRHRQELTKEIQRLARQQVQDLGKQTNRIVVLDGEGYPAGPLGALNWALLEQIAVLEPFGRSNPQPVLISRHVRVVSSRATGADGQHLKLRLDAGAGGPSYDAIAFRLGQLAPHFAKPRVIDIAYTLEANEWNGSRNLQLNIKDLRQPQA